MSIPDNPALWAARQIDAATNMIPEDSPYGWVRNKLANTAAEIRAIDHLMNCNDKSDRENPQ